MIDFDKTIDYYQVLNVSQDANKRDIKKAYHRLALRHHPDKGGAPEQFQKLGSAYEILMDEKTRNNYDKCRAFLIRHKTNHAPERSPPSCMVFSASNHTQSVKFTQTQSVSHCMQTFMASGIKAESLTPEELFNLAFANEAIALAICQDPPSLKRLSHSHFRKLTFKHKTFAFQLLSDENSRPLFQKTLIHSSNLVALLKKDYNLLLLITSSEALTNALLFPNHCSFLKGKELHEIYQHHVNHGYSGQAFFSLLEKNAPLNDLFSQYKKNQKRHTSTQQALFDLNFIELSKLAQKDTDVALFIVTNDALLNKFSTFEHYLVELLTAQPGALNAYFKAPRKHFLHSQAAIAKGCITNNAFLNAVLNSEQEKNCLNGYHLNQIIQTKPSTLTRLKKNGVLLSRYIEYQSLINYLSMHEKNDGPQQLKHLSILNQMNSIELLSIIKPLLKIVSPSALASKCVHIIKQIKPSSAHTLFRFCELSDVFFNAFLQDPTLKKTLHNNTFKLCLTYFPACNAVLQNNDAFNTLTNEQIYELHQKWIVPHRTAIITLFNNNDSLMHHWNKGRTLKKIKQAPIIATYQKQRLIAEGSKGVMTIRQLIFQLEQQLLLRNIILPINTPLFASWLFEQRALILKLTHAKHLLPATFWFLIFITQPHLLTEALPLELMQEQLEKSTEKLKKSQAINGDCFLDASTTLSFLTNEQQETTWFKQLFDENHQNEINTPLIVQLLEKNKEKCLTLMTKALRNKEEVLALSLFSLMHQGRRVNSLNEPLTDWNENAKDDSPPFYPQLIIAAGMMSLIASIGLFILAQPMILPALLLTFAIGAIPFGGYQLNQAYEKATFKASPVTYREALESENLSLFFGEKPKHPMENAEKAQNHEDRRFAL